MMRMILGLEDSVFAVANGNEMARPTAAMVRRTWRRVMKGLSIMTGRIFNPFRFRMKPFSLKSLTFRSTEYDGLDHVSFFNHRQRLVQIGNEVIHIFDTDADTE